jgi:hypothetical protein
VEERAVQLELLVEKDELDFDDKEVVEDVDIGDDGVVEERVVGVNFEDDVVG